MRFINMLQSSIIITYKFKDKKKKGIALLHSKVHMR